MRRRDFIRKTALASIASALGFTAIWKQRGTEWPPGPNWRQVGPSLEFEGEGTSSSSISQSSRTHGKVFFVSEDGRTKVQVGHGAVATDSKGDKWQDWVIDRPKIRRLLNGTT